MSDPADPYDGILFSGIESDLNERADLEEGRAAASRRSVAGIVRVLLWKAATSG